MKVILGVAAAWGVPEKHVDVPNAYVKAYKEELLDILLHESSGMKINEENFKRLGVIKKFDVVLELKKSLYGLKQAGRVWSQLLQTKLRDEEFKKCIGDMCLYYTCDGHEMIIVDVYDDAQECGTVSKFLGIRLKALDTRAYVLDQEEAIDELLVSTGWCRLILHVHRSAMTTVMKLDRPACF